MNAESERHRARLRWGTLSEETGEAGLVCRRCGISRPTLRKWGRRFQDEGGAGLSSRSRRPHHSPARVTGPDEVASIIKLRKERNLRPKGIQSELLSEEGRAFSTATNWKVVNRFDLDRVRAPKRPLGPKRCVCPTPAQLDTLQVSSGRIQFTAIDDCTRMRVLGLYDRKTAANTVRFLEGRTLEEVPFPIHRIQTDRGGEFFALTFQKALKHQRIKFRPTRPRSPHLNGNPNRLTDGNSGPRSTLPAANWSGSWTNGSTSTPGICPPLRPQGPNLLRAVLRSPLAHSLAGGCDRWVRSDLRTLPGAKPLPGLKGPESERMAVISTDCPCLTSHSRIHDTTSTPTRPERS